MVWRFVLLVPLSLLRVPECSVVKVNNVGVVVSVADLSASVAGGDRGAATADLSKKKK
jgi:hypothetical protein